MIGRGRYRRGKTWWNGVGEKWSEVVSVVKLVRLCVDAFCWCSSV